MDCTYLLACVDLARALWPVVTSRVRCLATIARALLSGARCTLGSTVRVS